MLYNTTINSKNQIFLVKIMNKLVKNFINITRVKRPVGIILLLIPCLIGVFSSNDQMAVQIFTREVLILIALFMVGSLVMRSAGCIINDIFDRKIDRDVSRTKDRPLASGEMKLLHAVLGLLILLIVGLLILLQFSINAIICGIFSLFLVILYPLMKRVTYFPQIFLGIVYNIGFLIAILEVKSEIVLMDLLIYFSLITLTFIYDTVYGFQDIEDDLKIGVKSSSIAVSKGPKKTLVFLAFIAFSLLFCFGYINGYEMFFFVINITALFYSVLLISKCNIGDENSCLKVFKKFTYVGFIVMISFIFKMTTL